MTRPEVLKELDSIPFTDEFTAAVKDQLSLLHEHTDEEIDFDMTEDWALFEVTWNGPGVRCVLSIETRSEK